MNWVLTVRLYFDSSTDEPPTNNVFSAMENMLGLNNVKLFSEALVTIVSLAAGYHN
jgi:hypothetical protein